MKNIFEIKDNARLVIQAEGVDGFAAFLIKPYKQGQVSIIASWSGGWEHVSVSMKNRCPAWEEMCMVKDIFWEKNECVVQFHPPENDYVNLHPFCLHLWKKVDGNFDMPPKEYI